jgi:hypothetical protein
MSHLVPLLEFNLHTKRNVITLRISSFIISEKKNGKMKWSRYSVTNA